MYTHCDIIMFVGKSKSKRQVIYIKVKMSNFFHKYLSRKLKPNEGYMYRKKLCIQNIDFCNILKKQIDEGGPFTYLSILQFLPILYFPLVEDNFL